VLGRRHRIRPPGLFALYVTGYSGFRIFEELLRVDPSHRILGLRLNFYVASALRLIGLAWFVRTQRADITDATHSGVELPEREPGVARTSGYPTPQPTEAQR
jgi:prolipoprotein diacylglyceryltransferase